MAEGPLTPLISAKNVPKRYRPLIEIPECRFYPLEEHGTLRADGGAGDPENHQLGILGEYALARFLGIEKRVDTELYDDGDGGVDLNYAGNPIDVKAAGLGRSDPALTVGAYKPLNAQYYVLANRIGPSQFRLVGYCPRHFVANAPVRDYDGDSVHVVPQEDLFPFPFWLTG